MPHVAEHLNEEQLTNSLVFAVGAWQPYGVQYFLFVRHASPFQTALYYIPNGIVGILAVYAVQKTFHRFSSKWIFAVSMPASALSPALFLPMTPRISYWALAMPGIALITFNPDMSFVAASIFITSSVPKSYQGAAGSLLITIENLSSAVFVAVAGAIGTAVNGAHGVHQDDRKGESWGQGPGADLRGLKACWWFAMSVTIFAALITAAFVRIKKAVESDHVAEDQGV
ncbi:MAG: hypothetical protein M1820_009893 [Bogoriella megaspora]|nr:MAG: hypothetical protein M1820_009893 [Bogoriella megaspora]